MERVQDMIKHAFVSAVADDADATKVQPSDWNDAHVVEILTSDPAAPVSGELWMLATGTSPDRLYELKFCDTDLTVVTLLSVIR